MGTPEMSAATRPADEEGVVVERQRELAAITRSRRDGVGIVIAIAIFMVVVAVGVWLFFFRGRGALPPDTLATTAWLLR